MPELPEVETTVRNLKKRVLKRTFIDVWTDFEKMIKKPSFKDFKKEIINKKIKDVRRRAKFILFKLSDNKTLLVHQKLTGHFLLGKWKKVNNKWEAKNPALKERVNTYIHLLFILDNGQMLALSDLRKFAKVELWNNDELAESETMKNLGPEPLGKNFTTLTCINILKAKKGKIKQVLMDQSAISGIGNIYSDEILFDSKINPFKFTFQLTENELKRICSSIPKILKIGIKLQGESISDWRTIEGKKGSFDDYRNVYQKEGKKCFRCKGLIVRKKIGGRSAHFCPRCQK